MAAKGYTTKQLVADELGRTLTAGQQTQCDGLIEEAEDLIDLKTGREWLVASPVTDEIHTPVKGIVYLDRTPVTAVTAVSFRSRAIGDTDTALVDAESYELLDAAHGVLLVGDYDDGLVKVSYTHTSPLALPGDIQRAATLLVAHWMTPRLDPSLAAMESVSVGQGDVAVKYRAIGEYSIPDRVCELLGLRKRMAIA